MRRRVEMALSWSELNQFVAEADYDGTSASQARAVADVLRRRFASLKPELAAVCAGTDVSDPSDGRIEIFGEACAFSKALEEQASTLVQQAQCSLAEARYAVYVHHDRQERFSGYNDASTDDALEPLDVLVAEKVSILALITHLFTITRIERHGFYSEAKELCLELLEDAAFPLYLIRNSHSVARSNVPTAISQDVRLAAKWLSMIYRQQMELLRILFLVSYDWVPPTQQMVKEWVSGLASISQIQPLNEDGEREYRMLVAMGLVISLQVLSSDKALSAVDRQSWVSDKETVGLVNAFVSKHEDDRVFAPVVLEWGYILHQFHLLVEEEGEAFMQKSFKPLVDLVNTDGAQYQRLITRSTRAGFFGSVSDAIESLSNEDNLTGYKLVVIQSVRHALEYVSYSPRIVASLKTLFSNSPGLTSNFAWEKNDKFFGVISASRVNFPFDFKSFTVLMTSLCGTAHAVYDYIADIPSFTQAIPQGFRNFDIVAEEESSPTILITIKESLVLYAARQSDGGGSVIISPGTHGRILTTHGSPTLVMWDYPFNGWAYYGRILETAAMQPLNSESAEIVCLVLKLLTTISNADATVGEYTIRSASDALADGVDLFDVVAQILDSNLRDNETSADSKWVITACLEFFTSMIPFAARSVWPVVTRVAIFDRHDRQGRLDFLISGVELPSRRFDALAAFVNLFNVLMRYEVASLDNSDGFSSSLKKDFIQSSLELLTDTSSSMNDWRFEDPEQRFSLQSSIYQGFNFILRFACDLTLATPAGSKSDWPLTASVNYLQNYYLAQAGAFRIKPLVFGLNIIPASVSFQQPSYLAVHSARIAAAEECFAFITNLLTLRRLLIPDPTYLEQVLFDSANVLVSFVNATPSLNSMASRLLSELISAPRSGEIPSLLAYIGNADVKFLRACSLCLGSKIYPLRSQKDLWRFLSTTIRNNQKGLAILMMTSRPADTGSPGNTRTEQIGSSTSDSLIRIAESSLLHVDLDVISRPYLLAVLEFIQLSRNFWGSSLGNSQQELPLWNKIVSCVQLGKKDNIAKSSNGDEESFMRLWIASFAVQACAIQCFISTENKSVNVKKLIIEPLSSNMEALVLQGFSLLGYRASLHGNLSRNFKLKWPHLNLSDFLVRTKNPYVPPSSHFYDTESLRLVLKPGKASASYLAEIEAANRNMALLDAQLGLLRSWASFAIAFHSFARKDISLMPMAFSFGQMALKSICDEQYDMEVIQSAMYERSRVVFSLANLIQRVDASAIQRPALEGLLQSIWRALSSARLALQQTLVSGNMDSPRLLLQAQYQCLRQASRSATTDDSNLSADLLRLSIFESYVCRSGRLIFLNFVKGAARDMLVDAELLTATSEIIVSDTKMKQYETELAIALESSNVTRAALAAFSTSEWSEAHSRYAVGEVAIEFLSGLSYVPALAERIASERVAVVITEGNIGQAIQRGGVRPETSPSVHRIWSKGILPLLLNLIRHMGARLVDETMGLLRNFERQIQTVKELWVSPDTLTTPMIDETALLLLILQRVGKYLPAGLPSAYKDFVHQIHGATLYLTTHPKFLSALVRPMTTEEQQLATQNPRVDEYNDLILKVTADVKMLNEILASMVER